MSSVVIPENEWMGFLQGFSARHQGWLVRLQTHDRETEETVVSRYVPLQSIEVDTEDTKNTRINVTVDSGGKPIKHILFRPWRLTLHVTGEGADESLQIESLNTTTTVRFRAAIRTERVDEVA